MKPDWNSKRNKPESSVKLIEFRWNSNLRGFGLFTYYSDTVRSLVGMFYLPNSKDLVLNLSYTQIVINFER